MMFAVAILVQGAMSTIDDAVSNISRVVQRHRLNKGLKHQVRFVNDLAKNCVADECDILHTLLRDRGSWHPAAPTVLEKVSSRRLSEEDRYCYGRAQDACTTQPAWLNDPYGGTPGYGCKGSCVWVDRDNNCQEPNCELYESSDTCCDNAMNVPSGCIWMADNNSDKGGSCRTMVCSRMDEWTCAAVKGCKVECDACSPEHFTDCDCSVEEHHKRCEPPRQGFDLLQLPDMLNCPAMGCTMCLKGLGGAGLGLGSSGFSLDKEKVKELYKGACNENCTDIAQCEDEAVCLLSDPGRDPDRSYQWFADVEDYEQCKVMPSCAAQPQITTSTTTVLSAEETCAQTCDEFDEECGSCGGEAPCGSSSGARRVCMLGTAGCPLTLIVLGTILFVQFA